MNSQIENLDTVIVSNNHPNKLFAGRIGFVIELRNDNDDKETRYDVQFPYDIYQTDDTKKFSSTFQQCQYGIDDITLLQKY